MLLIAHCRILQIEQSVSSYMPRKVYVLALPVVPLHHVWLSAKPDLNECSTPLKLLKDWKIALNQLYSFMFTQDPNHI